MAYSRSSATGSLFASGSVALPACLVRADYTGRGSFSIKMLAINEN